MATLHLRVETTGLILAPEQHTESALAYTENTVLFSNKNILSHGTNFLIERALC